ncbi:MarR family winged helix-turn-helix transcriptional regulator [Sphingobium sp. sgz301304]|uniref:MarR family winged helix-turn-helix transcriptional regulator n=1 Tax=Sphingobium sp. sgz301304 TaxID=3341828 RepID=UPI0035A6F59F
MREPDVGGTQVTSAHEDVIGPLDHQLTQQIPIHAVALLAQAKTRYAGRMSDPTEDQLAALSAAFDTFARRYKLADARRSERPLAELDKAVLLYVADHAGCGPTDVARFLAVPTTTLSSATDRLVKRGFLKRERIEVDRRAVALTLSEAGAAHAQAQVEKYRQMYMLMLSRLSAEERDRFIAMITKIVYNED